MNKIKQLSLKDKRCRDLYKDFELYCEENRFSETDSDAISDWLSINDNDGYGIEWFLCQIINKSEGICLKCDGSFIGIEMCCPWDMSANMKNLTEEKFINIMNKYINNVGVSQQMYWYCLKVRPGNSYGHHLHYANSCSD